MNSHIRFATCFLTAMKPRGSVDLRIDESKRQGPAQSHEFMVGDRGLSIASVAKGAVPLGLVLVPRRWTVARICTGSVLDSVS
jgi:hypothetical protein